MHLETRLPIIQDDEGGEPDHRGNAGWQAHFDGDAPVRQ